MFEAGSLWTKLISGGSSHVSSALPPPRPQPHLSCLHSLLYDILITACLGMMRFSTELEGEEAEKDRAMGLSGLKSKDLA